MVLFYSVFIVNGNFIPTEPDVDVNYLFDTDLPQTTLTLICPSSSTVAGYIDEVATATMGEGREFLLLFGTGLLQDGVTNVTDIMTVSGSLEVVPFPGTIITYSCDGEATYFITIIAGGIAHSCETTPFVKPHLFMHETTHPLCKATEPICLYETTPNIYI